MVQPINIKIFETGLPVRAIPEYIIRFWTISQRDGFRKMCQDIHNNIKMNYLYREYYQSYMPVQYSFFLLMKKLRFQYTIDPVKEPQLYHAIAFIFGFLTVYDILSSRARVRLLGALKRGLDISDQSAGLGPLAFEVSTAAHLSTNGWMLHFNDLENENNNKNYDFLVSKQNNLIEVECKYISFLTGLPIHPGKVLRLIGEMGTNKNIFKHQGCRIIVLLDVDGWSFSPNQKREIMEVISSEKITATSTIKVEFNIFVRGLVPSRDIGADQADVKACISNSLGVYVKYALVIEDTARSSSIIIAFQSKKEVKFIEQFRKRLITNTGSASQFTNNRLSSLWVQLGGVSEEEIYELGNMSNGMTPHSLDIIASDVIRRRPNLVSLVFRGTAAKPTLSKKAGPISFTRQVAGNERTIYYPDADHPLADSLIV